MSPMESRFGGMKCEKFGGSGYGVRRVENRAGVYACLCNLCSTAMSEAVQELNGREELLIAEEMAWRAALAGANSEKLTLGIEALQKIARARAQLRKEGFEMWRSFLGRQPQEGQAAQERAPSS